MILNTPLSYYTQVNIYTHFMTTFIRQSTITGIQLCLVCAHVLNVVFFYQIENKDIILELKSKLFFLSPMLINLNPMRQLAGSSLLLAFSNPHLQSHFPSSLPHFLRSSPHFLAWFPSPQ